MKFKMKYKSGQLEPVRLIEVLDVLDGLFNHIFKGPWSWCWGAGGTCVSCMMLTGQVPDFQYLIFNCGEFKHQRFNVVHPSGYKLD